MYLEDSEKFLKETQREVLGNKSDVQSSVEQQAVNDSMCIQEKLQNKQNFFLKEKKS